MKQKLLFFFLLFHVFSFGQQLEIGKSTSIISFDGSSELNFTIDLKKDEIYLFTIYQNMIDVEAIIFDSNGKQVAYTDLADGNNGYDKIEFSPEKHDHYKLVIRSVEKSKKTNGTVEVSVKKFSKEEIKIRKKIADDMKEENTKDIFTLDITHFWEAYDQLQFSKTTQDSINTIQKLYLDRGTDGLKEFQKVRYFGAEFFVERIKKYKKFYQSVRNNTMLPLQIKDLPSLIGSFKNIYPDARPAKICFAIGPMSTGGTISNNYLLIGVEMLAGNKDCDVSEITNENLKASILSRPTLESVKDFIKETAAHEYIHTQQSKNNKNACECSLLDNIIREGVASYISEKLMMQQKENNSRTFLYVKENEKKLWVELKSELCSKDFSKWLFNAASSKDRPGDLGYRIGYNLAESYYENAIDKKSAVKEMIEMNNPLLFLDKSLYDLKFR
ncbi:DUF2268 domain-containing putative Zn-dependent protease [Chryseobacterium polytrichastri]|uniref:Predicted Zn-dependent protease n=1 Tax=Chryseobacterium polytrichastri TaxID=1302687 RepID=A0A1M6Z1N2_9FLAO|nr:DUF2268 domain-containing putative Zn-dependent protease [Chryseobacterium polytrichastri]SHL24262.1 Predicted Zn-dependent protease [Chryseobacterium polytrichastri]